MYDSGMKWQKSKPWAADNGEIFIVCRRKETVGVLRSSGSQTVLLWNNPLRSQAYQPYTVDGQHNPVNLCVRPSVTLWACVEDDLELAGPGRTRQILFTGRTSKSL